MVCVQLKYFQADKTKSFCDDSLNTGITDMCSEFNSLK
jgi:hypothetical protein